MNILLFKQKLPLSSARFDFLSETLNPSLSFLRASTESYCNLTGSLVSAPADTPCFDHHPVTAVANGLQIYEGRTNQIRPSVPNGTDWSKPNITITGASDISPDGTLSAAALVETTATGQHFVSPGTASFVGGKSYVLSIYVKASTATVVQLSFGSSSHGGAAYANFNLSAGAIGTVGASITGYGITPQGNGWYRAWICAPATATISYTAACIVHTNNNASSLRVPSYTGTGLSFLAWGAQLETGSFPTPYIPTTTAVVTRAVDLCSISSPSWLSPSEFSIGCEIIMPIVSTTQPDYYIAAFDDGTTSNVISLGINGSGKAVIKAMIGGVLYSSGLSSTLTAGGIVKLAASFEAGNNLFSCNGTTLGAGTLNAVTVPASATRLGIGSGSDGVCAIQSCVRRIIYWKNKLQQSQLNMVTA